MQSIVPHLWYDKQAGEAADLYASLFNDSKIIGSTIIHDTPSGNAESIVFALSGQEFMAISAGPIFTFNPSVSFMVKCDSKEEIDEKWNKFSKNGAVLMPLGEYPFNKYYGWIQDRYGLSWQIMLDDGSASGQKITPNLLFSGRACGKAEEAVRYYTEMFDDSNVDFVSRYTEQDEHIPAAKVNFVSFRLRGMSFSAMDNAYDVDYTFNEAISFVVHCRDQKEIDHYWDKLSAVPEAEQCGWLKDRYGVSWQIVPTALAEMMASGSEEQVKRVSQAFMKMKKLDLQELTRAYNGI